MSDVSDIDEMGSQHCNSDDNIPPPSPEYVHKLKLKLKKCTSKIRDRNKIIKNQNEDIDNFLEDITSKESKISQLQDVIEQLKRHKGEAEATLKKEIMFDDVSTPSFTSLESRQSSFSVGNDSLVRELFGLVEECCIEIQSLQDLVKEAPSTAEVQEMRDKLRVSQAKVNYLRAKLSKCVELGLISASVSREERMYDDHCPNMLEIPGKTVNEIKAENELLQVYNNELKEEIAELQKQQEQMIMAVGGVAEHSPTLHSSMYREHDEDSSSKMEADSIEEGTFGMGLCGGGDDENCSSEKGKTID